MSRLPIRLRVPNETGEPPTGVGVHNRGFVIGSIEACIFNKRVADKVSPDLQGYGLPECSFKMQTTI